MKKNSRNKPMLANMNLEFLRSLFLGMVLIFMNINVIHAIKTLSLEYALVALHVEVLNYV